MANLKLTATVAEEEKGTEVLVPSESVFVSSIKEVLSRVGNISRDDVEQAIRLIKQHYRESRKTEFRSKGLCLNCRSVEIEYGYPCRTHQQKGDQWLDNLFEKWRFPPIVVADWRDIKVNGFSLTTISPYICENCTDEINGLVESAKHKKRELDSQAAANRRRIEHEILMGERKATPAKRYWILRQYFTSTDIEKLKALPYRDFLTTIYWQIVRNYVLYKRGYSCELCNNKDSLNVHHKTYEHHGEEHLHLEDLIVLCRMCHSKFHDKIVEPEDE